MQLATTFEQLHAPPPAGALDRFQRIARAFSHPRVVLEDRRLDPTEKRAVLAFWASDASAVQEDPSLRWLLGTEQPGPLSEVRETLQHLETMERDGGSARH